MNMLSGIGPKADLVPGEEPADIAKLVKLTGAREHRMFSGRLDRQRLGFAEKAVGKAVHAPEGDYRDWSAIDGFAGEIAAQLAAAHLPEGGDPRKSREPGVPTFARVVSL